MKNILSLFLAVMICSSLLVSCDEHISEYDSNIHVGMILCSDGHIRTMQEVQSTSSIPTAVVFYASEDMEEGTGYAVYLHDISSSSFSDTTGTAYTSSDITSLDGNINTYNLYTSGMSPMADAVYNLWSYGQSAYIPSVAQWRLLYRNRDAVNKVIANLGGEALSIESDKCWYWTSTEVEDQQAHKAWLFSVESGEIHETPKDQSHRVRPIGYVN